MEFFDLCDVRRKLGDPACYEQLAEESSELSHAALKMARVLRGENPTPVDYETAKRAVIEEYSDVNVAALALLIFPDTLTMQRKSERWIDRIMEDEYGD